MLKVILWVLLLFAIFISLFVGYDSQSLKVEQSSEMKSELNESLEDVNISKIESKEINTTYIAKEKRILLYRFSTKKVAKNVLESINKQNLSVEIEKYQNEWGVYLIYTDENQKEEMIKKIVDTTGFETINE